MLASGALRDHKFHLKKYRACFVGTDAVATLVHNGAVRELPDFPVCCRTHPFPVPSGKSGGKLIGLMGECAFVFACAFVCAVLGDQAADADDAVALGVRMLRAGLVHHVAHEHPSVLLAEKTMEEAERQNEHPPL